MALRHGLTAAFLMIVLLSGCASLVQTPRVMIKETKLVGLDTAGINIELKLGITNLNSFDLSLLGCTFDLKVQDLPLSTGGLQGTILFPAGEETGVLLPIRLKFTDLLKIINRVPDPDNIPYQLNAVLHLKMPLGELTVPVEKSAVLAIPEQYRSTAVINLLRDTLRGIR